MRFLCASLLCFALLSTARAFPQQPAAAGNSPVPLDKGKVESYLRYAEGFSSPVKIQIDDPVASSIHGYYRLSVHLSMGDTKQDKIYFLSSDGKQILTGPIWELSENPFRDTAEQLPTKGPSFGPPTAKITLIVFSDFECPYCREFARTIRETLPQKYPKDVRVIFEDFPLESLHPWAVAAAEAGRCLEDQSPDSFWPYHDWIFQHQGEVNPGNLKEKVLGFAKEHKVDEKKLTACLDTHVTKGKVEESLKRGRMLGIQQTPTFYLNGRVVSGALPWTSLETLIQMELNRPGFIPGLSEGR
jgi:protein-disulfide isomerase